MHFKVSFMWQKYEKRGSFDLHIVFCHELEFAGDPSSCWISLIPGALLGAVWQVCLRGGTHSITALMALSVFR